jgi:hypothetical protein
MPLVAVREETTAPEVEGSADTAMRIVEGILIGGTARGRL